ncbi:MAG: hypothetical protein AAGC58_11135 [Asticcacaulis sp.]
MLTSKHRATLLKLLAASAFVWVAFKIQAYSNAHVTLMQTPCYSDFARCPSFQYDLFGDGTVVYQNVDLSDPVTYRISRLEAIHAIWRIDVSAIRNGYWEGAGGIHTPSCIVHFRLARRFVENVCGTPHLGETDRIEPAFIPLIKVLRLDTKNSDYAPTLPDHINAQAFVFSSKYPVDPLFWKPSPPPPPEQVSSPY